MLSRAEQLLILVGSWKFFDEQLAYVNLDEPANPLWSWKKLLSLFEEAFAAGDAVRIPDKVLFTAHV